MRDGQVSHHEEFEAIRLFLLPCATTELSLIAMWRLSGATSRGQPWTPAVTRPHGRDGLSARRMAVLWTFREPSLCRHVHRELMRKAALNLTLIIPATACHQRNYVERYSRSIEFDQLGRHAFDCMVMCTAPPSPGMRSATGLHTAEHWGQCGDTEPQGLAGEALAQDDLAPLVHPDNVKEPLCDVNAQYAHMVFHGTRLLWLNGFTGLEIILAH